MPYVGLEFTIPASERTKTVYALDRVATMTGIDVEYRIIKLRQIFTNIVTDILLSRLLPAYVSTQYILQPRAKCTQFSM
jgi:hypothetical protein